MMMLKFIEYAYGLLQRNVRPEQVCVILRRDLAEGVAKRVVDSAQDRFMRERKKAKR